jgi:hypothetical protein
LNCPRNWCATVTEIQPGSIFRTQRQPDPRRFSDLSQTPKFGFWDEHHRLPRAEVQQQRLVSRQTSGSPPRSVGPTRPGRPRSISRASPSSGTTTPRSEPRPGERPRGQSPVALPPPLMRRHEGNLAGAHFRAPGQPHPRRLRDGTRTPKIGVRDRRHYFQGPRMRPKSILPHGG